MAKHWTDLLDVQQIVALSWDKQPTLAEVIANLEVDPTLPPGLRKRLVNDIRTACRWFEKSPEELIAHAMNLRARFKRVSPGRHGVTLKRIQNVRSSVKAALKRVKVIDGRTFNAPFTMEWRSALSQIHDPYLRKKINCLARFASAKGIRPEGVDDKLSADLLKALEANRLHANPRITHQCATRSWNQLVRTHPHWPGRAITQPRYRKVKTPDVDFHSDLQAALAAFLERNATTDPFDLTKPIVPWKASTVETYRRYLKRYVGLLITLGHEPDSLRRLQDLVPYERAKSALQLMMQQNDGRSRIGASHIARLLSQVAQQAVQLERNLSETEIKTLKSDAKRLRELADRLHKRINVLGQKNRERLRPFRDEANLARLFLLPFALATEAETRAMLKRDDALLMQWALALMILTFCPLRISSLANLRIDRHLIWSRPNMKGELRLEFDWRELKSDAPEVLPLPAECARLLRLYLERFRPLLRPGASPFLFPGQSEARAKKREVLSQQLQTLIFKRLGFDVNPHLFSWRRGWTSQPSSCSPKILHRRSVRQRSGASFKP